MSRQPQARQAKSKSRQDNYYALKDKAECAPPRCPAPLPLPPAVVRFLATLDLTAHPPATVHFIGLPSVRTRNSFDLLTQSTSLSPSHRALPQRMGTIDLDRTAVTRMGDVSVELKDVSLTFGGAPILKEFTYSFSRGERVALVGPNGAGKTTFLKVCLGQQAVDSGLVKIGETVKFGHYSQIADFPNPNMARGGRAPPGSAPEPQNLVSR